MAPGTAAQVGTEALVRDWALVVAAGACGCLHARFPA